MSDLDQVVALIKAGEKVEARKRLLVILAQDRNNEKAWVYMALCAANRQELVASVRHALRVNPKSVPALKLANQHQIPVFPSKPSPPSRKPDAEVVDDPYPTQESHPTQLLPPRQTAAKPKMNVKSDFAMPDWVSSEFKEDTLIMKRRKKAKQRGRAVVFSLVVVFLIATVGLLALIVFTDGDDGLGANAQTATSISGTNAVVVGSQQARATSISQTLNPPTPTRPPRENAQ